MSRFRRATGILFAGVLLSAAGLLAGCEASALPVIPTARPTETATPTGAPTRTPGRDATPSPIPSLPPASPTGGPSPTPLFGLPAAIQPTASRVVDPNAPRIEFFTTDVLSVAPGDPLNLYWSTRNTTSANIYRLERGVRNDEAGEGAQQPHLLKEHEQRHDGGNWRNHAEKDDAAVERALPEERVAR